MLSPFFHLQSFAPRAIPNHCLPLGFDSSSEQQIKPVFPVPVTQVRQADDYPQDIAVKILTKT